MLGLLGREPESDVELASGVPYDLPVVTGTNPRATPEEAGRATQDWIFSYAPAANSSDAEGGGGNVSLPRQRDSDDLALDSGWSALDGDIFAALAGVFGPDSFSGQAGGGGGGAALDGSSASLGGGGGVAGAAGGDAGGGGGVPGSVFGDGAAGSASMPAFPSFIPSVSNAPTITTTPATTSQSISPVSPMVPISSALTPGSAHATPPVSTPVSSHPSTPAIPLVTFSPPVLQSVERFGPAGHGRLFIEGSVANTTPLGTKVQLDFYAAPVQGQGSGLDTASARLLASKTVTQTTAGSIAFTVNLETEVPPGTMIAAAVHGRDAGPNWSQGVELFDGQHGASLPGQPLRESMTVPAGINGENITLESPGHSLENIQVIHPPGLDKALPLGLVCGGDRGGVHRLRRTVRLLPGDGPPGKTRWPFPVRYF